MTNYDEFEFDVNYNLVSDKNSNYQIDLKSRLLDFAVDTLRFLSTIPDQKEYNVLKYQLSKSATSIGANFEEAQSSGDKEFIYKLRIALREANETHYWYKIIDKLGLSSDLQRTKLLNESKELSLILGSIVSKLNRKIEK